MSFYKVCILFIVFVLSPSISEAERSKSELYPSEYPELIVAKYSYLAHPFYEYGVFGVGMNIIETSGYGSLFSIDYSKITDKTIGYIYRLKFDWPWKFWRESEEFYGWEDDLSYFADDFLVERRLAGVVLDGGVTYGIGPNLHIVTGAGLGYHNALHRYEESNVLGGRTGYYYWAGVPENYLDLNLFFGFGMRFDNYVGRVTWNRLPRGINLTVGIGG